MGPANGLYECGKSRIYQSSNREPSSPQRVAISITLTRSLLKYKEMYFWLCGYETWDVKLNEKYRLKVFKNRLLIKIVWPKRGKVTADWKRLCNGELHDLHSSSVIRVVKSRR